MEKSIAAVTWAFPYYSVYFKALFSFDLQSSSSSEFPYYSVYFKANNDRLRGTDCDRFPYYSVYFKARIMRGECDASFLFPYYSVYFKAILLLQSSPLHFQISILFSLF